MNDDPNVQNQPVNISAQGPNTPITQISSAQPVQPQNQFSMQQVKKPKKFKLLLIIATVLAVGGLGFLGYYLINSSRNDLTEIVTDNLLGTNISLKYPKAWTFVADTDASTTVNIASITSPDKAIAVALSMVKLPVGTAEADDHLNETLALFETGDIANYPKAFLAARVFKMANNLYRYTIGTETNTEAMKSSKVGDISSEYTSDYGPNWLNVSDLTGNQGDYIGASISLNNLKDREITSLDNINSEMQNSNYLTAKKIVQSMYVK